MERNDNQKCMENKRKEKKTVQNEIEQKKNKKKQNRIEKKIK
jgi:hypothetical protein